jgi:hypothetical protein
MTEYTEQIWKIGPNPLKEEANNMADKVKFAFLLAGGCAGCEMALVDISEKLVDALDHLEIVFWAPTVADVKYKDLEAMPDKFIDLAFVDGMIRNTENEHMVKVLQARNPRPWWPSGPAPPWAASRPWATCTPTRSSSSRPTRRPSPPKIPTGSTPLHSTRWTASTT